MGIQGRESSERREGGDEVSHLNWLLTKVKDGKGCRVHEAVEKVQDRAIRICALETGSRIGTADPLHVQSSQKTHDFYATKHISEMVLSDAFWAV